MSISQPTTLYVGRFAPSPTGDLHFGSLIAALASYLQAKSSNGKWLLRIEDIDPPREVPGSVKSICADLSRLGLISAESIFFQSDRSQAYELACAQLLAEGKAFWCGCSRKDLPSSGVYPGTCRNGIAGSKKPRSIRVRVGTKPIIFTDGLQGEIIDNLAASSGDFVIKRADGMAAYQLAVVLDDAFQGVTEVVRGADLLDSTVRQIWLQTCLGLPTPKYAHIPMAVDFSGTKLSKSSGSDPVQFNNSEDTLKAALGFLGHKPPEVITGGLLNWARRNWNLDNIPKEKAITFPIES
jgi:glutamyl-Q tRNA(Asp) synthetase